MLAKSLLLDTLRITWPVLPKGFAGLALRMMRIHLDRTADLDGVTQEARAIGCLSVDFDATRPGRLSSNRLGTRKAVELSSRYSIPMTWAICGKTAEDDPFAYEMV